MNSRWVGTNTYEWPNGSQSQLPGGGAPSSRGGDGVSGGGLEPVFLVSRRRTGRHIMLHLEPVHLCVMEINALNEITNQFI